MYMMQPPPQAGQTNTGDQMMEAPSAAPFTVRIDCSPDGTFAVGLQSDAPAAGAEGMKPARDVKEALTIALQIIKSGGKQGQNQADFQSGYNEMSER